MDLPGSYVWCTRSIIAIPLYGYRLSLSDWSDFFDLGLTPRASLGSEFPPTTTPSLTSSYHNLSSLHTYKTHIIDSFTSKPLGGVPPIFRAHRLPHNQTHQTSRSPHTRPHQNPPKTPQLRHQKRPMPSTTSPSPSKPPSASGSGIHTLPSGTRHIPPSTRADGSLRKEIKIRPGYRPPEDVEVYKNRTAEAWKMRGTGGVPGADGLEEEMKGEVKAGKNAKRREARRRAKGGGEGGGDGGGEGKEEEEGEEEEEGKATRDNDKTPVERRKNGGHPASPLPPPLPTSTADATKRPEQKDPDPDPDPELEKENKARALKKKLRQARELKEKKDSGEGLLPEQFAKVIKIQELMRQLDALGFDGDGARKARDVV